MSKFKLLTVLGALALACGAEVEPSAVDAALVADDQCSAEGEDGALCMLNALQMKAAKLEVDAAAESEPSSCTSGMVGQVRSFAPGCLDACPQACGPLGVAMNAYMTKGGQPAAKTAVCQYKSQFSCFLSSSVWPQCKELVEKAASFGFTLPHSVPQLNAGCE
mmetsp:Transcript_25242/g.64305  ORF Transcript_25242/g.64305 Transcript_25242/m.64305 type:complete len:163 (+) Transcript_25242:143-631(+)